ncbi:MAG: type IV secretory system conjugative DNA transfer family protein [Acidimicrobiales bacterium]
MRTRSHSKSKSAQQRFAPGWRGLVLGAGAGNWPATAGFERCAMVLSPPRSGKTSAIVIPCVLGAPGAVVSTSTKTDVADVTAWVRSRRGRCWVFDPLARTAPAPPLVAAHWSPVSGCEDWDAAVAMAHALVQAARPPDGTFFESHWRERADALLAPLLHAAGLASLEIGWVLAWVLRRELSEPLAVIRSRAGAPLAAAVLDGMAATDHRERSGIFSTAAGVLRAYRSQAALDNAAVPDFDPWSFVRSSDTLYIASPGTDQDLVAPIVVGLLDQVRRATYARGPGAAPVVFALDEVANIAPLPDLAQIVAEGASQGLVTLVCFQDLAQARARWGVAAEGFFSYFGAKVILAGIEDLRTLELISALVGEHDVPVRSVTYPRNQLFVPNARRAVPSVTYSTQRRPRLSVAEVARGVPGSALTIVGATDMGWTRLVPYWGAPWNEVLASARPGP